jgi:hypothetical protein
MRTRGTMMIGVAAGALALTACGTAMSSSGGIPGGHSAPAPARHAAAAAQISDRDALAQVKHHLTWTGGDPGAQRPQADTSSFTDQNDLAKLKRYIASRAAEQARGR